MYEYRRIFRAGSKTIARYEHDLLERLIRARC